MFIEKIKDMFFW